MNLLSFNRQPLSAQVFGREPPETERPFQTDAQGRPILRLDAVQTVAASSLDIRNLTDTRDTLAITALNFDMRSLSAARDPLTAGKNTFFTASGSAGIVLGGTTVLTVDTGPYAYSAFLAVVEFLALGTTVYLQTAPVNIDSYFVTLDSRTGLALGGKYLMVPNVPMRYLRIYGTGIGAQLGAYYFGQA